MKHSLKCFNVIAIFRAFDQTLYCMIKTVTRVDHGRCKLQKSLLLSHLDPIFSRISVQLKFSLDFTGAVLLFRLLDNTVEEFVTPAKVRNC